jgi:amino acid adenylation domain-containing protein
MLSDAQREQLTARLRHNRTDAPEGIPRRAPDAKDLPLSFGQEQLWFLDRFAPGRGTYNIPFVVRLRGPLDADALERALDRVVERHEVLRTRLVAGADGLPTQVIDQIARAGMQRLDLAGPGGEARLRELGAEEAMRPFSLAQGPLLRAWLAMLAAEEHALVLVVHHAVFDGWSIGVLLRELAALYAAEVTGGPSGLPELPVQFADYALWERGRLAGPHAEEIVEYWRSRLEGLPVLQLETDHPRPRLESFEGAVEWVRVGAGTLAGLRELSRRKGMTLFATVLAAYLAVLHRYTGQDDIVVGTLTANRGRSELRPLIGFLVNTLAVRCDLSGDPTFLDLLDRVAEATAGAYAHQDLPFAKLVEELQVERDPGRSPVFQTVFTMTEAPEEIVAAGVRFGFERIDLPAAKFDTGVLAEVRGDELWLEMTYATALFEVATARRLLEHLRVLLEGAVADPGRRLSTLPLLTDAELRRELVEWNDTSADLPVMCVHEAFERQAERTPDAVAAELDGVPVTYAELDADANRIARTLRELGVGREVMVGVCMERTPRRLAVLLGILKAGGAYVPLDPALPADRLSYMIGDTGMPVIATDAASRHGLPETAARILPLDHDLSGLDGSRPGFEVGLADLAYVIYTSGSTGRPKGVMVEHRNVSNHAQGMIRRFGVGPGDRVLQFASLNFDVSVMDMFTALLSGATAVLGPPETLLSPPRLAALIRERGVTFASLPPAVVSLLGGYDFPGLRVLMPAGEALAPELVERWVRPGLRFCNGYGPTEDTVIATLAELDGTLTPPPIGLPVANARAYVLDRYLNPVPVGVVGELHMGGAGVARGYLNAPELTAERFIRDPFADDPDARLYKTGDLVKRLPDGNLVYLGRMDGQVKIRGFRVELGEIESTLVTHPSVAQAVVVLSQDGAGEKHLVGYVRAEDGQAVAPAEELRRHLAEKLPSYMVPTYLVTLDAFPLNASGKIDRSRLPAPDATAPDDYVEPSTLIETVVADMYARLLGRERVGAQDGFFGLGGNSLQAMRLVTQLDEELDIDLNVASVFLAPTPRQLAAHLCEAHGLQDVDLGEDGIDGLTEDAETVHP